MATLHTNFLTGNDISGNGTAGSPYKTVNKALQVAIDGDLVKVAGGEIQSIAGTVTASTLRATTITTSIDLTSQFSTGDVIYIDTTSIDGFPLVASGFVINAITSNQISLNTNTPWSLPIGTYNIAKFSTYHYVASSNSQTLETISSFTATNVTVEGGWNSDFTTQIGWTACKTGSFTGVSFFNFTNLSKQNVVFNRFMSCTAGLFMGNTSQIGVNEVAVYNVFNGAFGSSNFSIYNPSPVGFTTIYSVGSQIDQTYNGGSTRPTTLNLKQWVTSGGAANRSALKVGFSGTSGNISPNVRTLEAYWRSTNNTSTNVAAYAPINSAGDVFIDDLNMFIGGGTITPITNNSLGDSAFKYIANLDVTSIDSNNNYITPGPTSLRDLIININRTAANIESLPWTFYGTKNPTETLYNTMRPWVWCKDTDGQKVISQDGIPKWADTVTYSTGSNSLRFKLIRGTVGETYKYVAAILNKPTSTGNLTCTARVRASKSLTLSQIDVLYGNSSAAYQNPIPSTYSIGTNWQDITFTINGGVSDWNLANDGLMQIMFSFAGTQVTSASEVVYFWVDSITVA